MGESRGDSPEIHDHLLSFECVKLQVVKTAPDSQLLNLLSISRLATVPDEVDQCGVFCKLHKLDRGVFGCAVVRVHICHTYAHILYTYATFLILLMDIFSNMNVKRIT